MACRCSGFQPFRSLPLLFLLSLLCCDSEGTTEPGLPTSIAVVPDSLSLLEGTSFQFIVAARSGQISQRDVAWSSDRHAVASVTPTGYLEAHAVGSATITARVGDLIATSHVLVRPAPARVVVVPALQKLLVGSAALLSGRVVGTDGSVLSHIEIVWSSDDPSIAEITRNGEARGIRAGTARIVGRAAGYEGWGSVEVLAPGRTLVAAASHTCAVGDDGMTYCAGANDHGQLGRGSFSELGDLARVEGPQFVALAAGLQHSCGIDLEGRAWCWGLNREGQLGDGTAQRTDRSSPVAVSGGHRFTKIVGGVRRTCALDETGRLWCWGLSWVIDWGESTPLEPLPGFDGFEEITIGGNHACALRSSGEAMCWGANDQGQLGVPAGTRFPRPVTGGHRFQAISAGYFHTCGLDLEGKALCWGQGNSGGLGNGRGGQEPNVTFEPVAVAGGHVFTRIDSNYHQSCGIDEAHQAFCWGGLNWGRSGGPPKLVPAAVPGGHSFARVVTGAEHNCALTLEGQALCWGYAPYTLRAAGASASGRDFTPYQVAPGWTFLLGR